MGILDLTALELGRKIKAKEITSVEAVQAVLEQIRKTEPAVHAYVSYDEESALKRAEEVQKQIDDGTLTGPLAGECFMALGSDTGGSIRQPASFCGITGMKPTYGTISRYGLIAYGSSLDQIGPMAKDVSDCAALLETVASYDKKDSTSIERDEYDFTSALVDDVKGSQGSCHECCPYIGGKGSRH